MALEDQSDAGVAVAETQDSIPKLDLDVKIEEKGACERHVRVSIPRKDIDRYFDRVFGDLAKGSNVPGFRAGKAPKKLIQARFRKEASEQVKSGLIVDSLSQLTESQQLAAIGEPNFSVDLIQIPADGPLVFEFDIEVRPDFQLPNWKGLEVERPVREIVDADVDARMSQSLENYLKVEKVDRPAKADDKVDLEFEAFDGDKRLSGGEASVRLRPTLRFQDGNVEGFDKLLEGASAGDVREGKAKLSEELADASLKGKEVALKIKVKGVSEVHIDALAEGSGLSVERARELVRGALARQLEYEQQQRVRKQILAALTSVTPIELPPDLLRRQAKRELDRSVLELQRSGFSIDQIKEHEATLRQNVLSETSRAMKEHFVLERIAEEEKIDADAADYEHEVMLLARQNEISPREVRARIEQNNQMDALRNQIVERKVLDKITAEAQIKEVPYDFPATTASTVSHMLSGAANAEESAKG